VHNRATEIETLYRQHGPALLLFAVAIAGEKSRAQDAVHQVFLKMIESGVLTQAVDAKAYLFASVRNALLNDAKVRQRNVPLEGEAVWFSPPDRDYAAELRLRRALTALPEDQREVTILHAWGEPRSHKLRRFWRSARTPRLRGIAMPSPSCARRCVGRRTPVPVPDDERFEQYLKQFRPLAPEPLPAVEWSRGTRRWLVCGALAAAAAVVVAAVLVLYPRPQSDHSPGESESVARVEQPPKFQPLTIGSANAFLASAPSFKAAVAGVAAQAFQSQGTQLSEGTQSALAVFSKEKTKL
jgi:hypothetical protein